MTEGDLESVTFSYRRGTDVDPDYTMIVMTTLTLKVTTDLMYPSWSGRDMGTVPMVNQDSFMINNRYPGTRGVIPWGIRDRNKTRPHFYKSCRYHFSRFRSSSIFFVKISISHDSLPNNSCFERFLKDPKGCKPEMVQGTHKFISDVIGGSEQNTINVVVFICLFNQFIKNPWKIMSFRGWQIHPPRVNSLSPPVDYSTGFD